MKQAEDSLKLVIQTYDFETIDILKSLGFQAISTISNLLYLPVDSEQLESLFYQLHYKLSENSQNSSRFLLTRKSLNSNELLVEFIHSQPLNTITYSLKHNWFLSVLSQQSLFFEYQPIFNLASGEVAAYECLARAMGEDGKKISGKALIDAAIFTKCTFEFDELAREICLQTLGEINNGQTFFINILPNAIIHNPQALWQNLQKIVDVGLKPQQIIFELTEVEVLTHCAELSQILDRVRSQGFKVAVDDLCSQASVDHYFMGFCPDIIKLDRQIVHGCSRHALQQVLLKSLLNTAHELEITVLAECLEDREDIEFCRDIGVDLGQGYGLGRPQLTLQLPSILSNV